MAVKARAEITLSSIRDIQSVTRYYLLQSSTSAVPSKPTTNPPGGNWVTSEPSYTSGSTNSLYFTDCTVFSDGTFVYSDVSLSSSYEAAKVAYNKAASAEDVANSASDKVDNLEVGSRNLVRRTDYSIYGNSNNYANANQAIFSSDRITIPFGKLVGHRQYTRNKLKTPIPKGTKIIMSVYVYEQTIPDGDHRLYVSGLRSTGGVYWNSSYKAIPYGFVGKFTWVNTIPEDFYGFVLDFDTRNGTSGQMVLGPVKAEIGNVATDWTPAPEDLEAEVNAAQETANGKNTVYYQTSAPTGGTYKTNDIWFDTNDGNKMHYWNGSAWTAEQFGNAAISDLSITNAKIANGTIESAKISNLDAGKVTSGTMSAARIKGDELKLGGDNNTDGVMKVYNANGELVGSFTKEGLMAIAGTIAGWTIEQDSLSGERDFGEEKWHVALSPAFGLRFRDIPDGADPDSGWIREVRYTSGLARFSHVSNGNNYTGVIEACNESDGIQVVPELVVSGVDFPDSDDPVTKITSRSVETDAVKGKGLYLHPLGTGNSFYLQQPIMIMAGQTTISNGTYLKQATMCTIPSAYWSGYRILPFVTRTYGNSGVAPADNGDFYYAYYNSADHNVCIKLANVLPSGANFTFDYFIYALPITSS